MWVNDDSVTLQEVGLNGASFPLDDAGENRLKCSTPD